MGRILLFVSRHRIQLLTIITPLVFLPIPILINDQKGTCGFLLLLMAVYWCTETLPLGVTGLLPVFLVPMFGIMSTTAVCLNYLKDVTVMLVGGLIVALAVESSMLHKRIALRVLLICGTKPQWLMLGFMIPTWFLSMWISNTATTAMMLPIMEAVLGQLNTQNEDDNTEMVEIKNLSNNNNETEKDSAFDNVAFTIDVKTNEKAVISGSEEVCVTELEGRRKSYDVEIIMEESEYKSGSTENKEFDFFAKGMTLAVAHAANVGGIATLTGTSPNTIMKGHADDLWQSKGFAESPVTYSSWMVVGLPVAFMNLIIVWLWLQVYFLGIRGTFTCFFRPKGDVKTEEQAKKVLVENHSQLGPIRFAEWMAGLMFSLLVLLWFFRSPGFIPGWAAFFEPGYIGDAVPAMMIACILFVIPTHPPTCDSSIGSAPVDTLLSWKIVHEKFPWSVIFLMGGGFALADACEVSGLSQWIGDQLSVFGSLPEWLMLIIVCLLVSMLTNVTSNAATATILMPITSAMAEGLGYNPLFLMFPAALSTSFSFMLPVATPPNAIAFAYGRLTVMDMVKTGALLSITGVLTVTFAMTTWAKDFFNLGELPWDIETGNNATMTTLLPCIQP